MEILSSKEYADKIALTTEEAELKESYEANLIEMGKRSAYEIQDAFIAGKTLAVKHIMDVYKGVKDYYSDKEGLTFECFDLMLAEAITEIMEENEI